LLDFDEGIVQGVLEHGGYGDDNTNVFEGSVPSLLVAPSIDAIASYEEADLVAWETLLERL
jgi:hypothetical protein